MTHFFFSKSVASNTSLMGAPAGTIGNTLYNDLRTQSLQLRDLQQRRDPSMPERPRKMINMDASPEPPRKSPVDDTDWFDPLPDF